MLVLMDVCDIERRLPMLLGFRMGLGTTGRVEPCGPVPGPP